MIKTEAQERKLNEDLFFQYLLGIRKNADKEEEERWAHFYETKNDDPEMSYAYVRYARASERRDVIDQIIKVYCNQIRGGSTL